MKRIGSSVTIVGSHLRSAYEPLPRNDAGFVLNGAPDIAIIVHFPPGIVPVTVEVFDTLTVTVVRDWLPMVSLTVSLKVYNPERPDVSHVARAPSVMGAVPVLKTFHAVGAAPGPYSSVKFDKDKSSLAVPVIVRPAPVTLCPAVGEVIVATGDVPS